MDPNFFQGSPDPQADPRGFSRQQMLAQALMQRGGQQGQMAGGQFIAPSPLSYASQFGNTMAGGYKMNQLANAQRGSDILNGVAPQMNGFQKIAGLLGGA